MALKTDHPKGAAQTPTETPDKIYVKNLPPTALRALAEAEERRRRAAQEPTAQTPAGREINGRNGPEPVRYGDWEVKGIASDF